MRYSLSRKLFVAITIVSFLALGTLLLLPSMSYAAVSAQASTYFVSPNGSDSNDGRSEGSALKTIQKALNLAQPGDTVRLLPGTYNQDIVSVRNGTSSAPITITGPANAIVKGGSNGRIVQVHHDYLIFDGFTIDGQNGSTYRGRLIYVLGTEPRDGVTGLKIRNMKLTNAGGECVRLRYFVQQSEISNNTIGPCGRDDYPNGNWAGGGKNGEGIYIGTAPEQRGDGKNPTTDPDQSNDNWIHHNTFDTQGNECVDIKESASGNIVEYNSCTGQKDENSAGFDSRGNGNIFRYNESFNNLGSGIRLGGDTKNDGISNDVYGNTLRNNKQGGIKFQVAPQGLVCGNIMSGNGVGDSVGSAGSSFKPSQPCPSNIPVQESATATKTVQSSPTATQTTQPSATATKTAQPSATATKPVQPSATATKPVEASATATKTVQPNKPAQPSVTSTPTSQPSEPNEPDPEDPPLTETPDEDNEESSPTLEPTEQPDQEDPAPSPSEPTVPQQKVVIYLPHVAN